MVNKCFKIEGKNKIFKPKNYLLGNGLQYLASCGAK